LIDPASPEAAKSRQAKAQQQQQQQAQAAALQRAVMLLEKYKVDIEALTKATEQIVKAAIEEAKLTLQPEPLQAAQMVAGENRAEASADANRSEAAASPGGAPQ
jgi:long-subunit acyl-CoA synthetase (AMP-forming)